MTKKDLIFLLIPSAFLCWAAGTLLFHADAFVMTDQDRHGIQQRIDEQVRKVKSGETPVTPENLVKAMSSSYLRAQDIQETVAGFYSQMARRCACAVLFGVAAQFYIVFRVKAGLRRRGAEPSSVANRSQPVSSEATRTSSAAGSSG